MCRFIAYIGEPILPSTLLHEPENSLINQSVHSRERTEPLNGDGFGLGWYNKSVSSEPALFRSIQPAWSNQNLKSIASKTETTCLFAHVRAATHGSTSEHNCHPFKFGDLLMMHNGEIENFSVIKRSVLECLSEQAFNWIQGETDSVHVFALMLTYLEGKSNPLDVLSALEKAIATIEKICSEKKVKHSSRLNLVVTNGEWIIATRYFSDGDPNTLYYSSGSTYRCENGVCKMDAENDSAVLIVSEKLTDREQDWKVVPENHAILVERDRSISLSKLTK